MSSANSGTTLAARGEHAFLARLVRLGLRGRDVEVGIGDDAAVVRCGRRRLLLTTDALVEGRHFRREWDSPEGLAARAFAVNASDLAAMGGRPRFALLSVAAPGGLEAAFLDRFVRAFAAACRRAGATLVGGNLSGASQWSITVTLVGEPWRRPLLRTGARAGADLWVSGELGGAAFGLETLLAGRPATPRHTARFRRPTARLELARLLARGGWARAAIDVSDGLVQDLGHLVRASGVGAVVEAAAVPLDPRLRTLPCADALRLALSGGEDYELLFAARRADRAAILRAGRRARCRVTRIGRFVPGGAVGIEGGPDAGALPRGGFDHFARRSPERVPAPPALR